METKRVVIEVPKEANTREVKAIVKRIFSFNVRKYYGRSRNFPKVRVRWQLSV
jgi:ribosomal protein L23